MRLQDALGIKTFLCARSPREVMELSAQIGALNVPRVVPT